MMCLMCHAIWVHSRARRCVPCVVPRARFLDRDSFDSVTSIALKFLLGMSEFSITGPPLFSEDDHHVTLPVSSR